VKGKNAETSLDLRPDAVAPLLFMGKSPTPQQDDRQAKLAAALRANLRRRKAAVPPKDKAKGGAGAVEE